MKLRDHVANPVFKEKRKLEMQLEKTFPKEYFSKYAMVTFNENIPYAQAMRKGRAQDKAILNMLVNTEIKNNDLKTTLQQIQTETKHILNEDTIAKLL